MSSDGLMLRARDRARLMLSGAGTLALLVLALAGAAAGMRAEPTEEWVSLGDVNRQRWEVRVAKPYPYFTQDNDDALALVIRRGAPVERLMVYVRTRDCAQGRGFVVVTSLEGRALERYQWTSEEKHSLAMLARVLCYPTTRL